MDGSKKYVTQLSSRDMAEIAAVANIQAGEGIVLTRNEKGIEVSIDKQALRMWIYKVHIGGEI